MSATMQSAAADGSAAAGTGHFVTFHVRDEVFGVPLAEVQEIIRMPDLVKVPLSPPTLEGIANLRGTVLPISSLRRTFGVEDVAHDDATRVVVINQSGGAVGFIVDRMASVITAEASEIESTEALEDTLGGDLLHGVVKRDSGMILLLESSQLATVIPKSDAPNGSFAGLRVRQDTAVADRGDDAVLDEIQLVSFEAAGQEYAFPIGDVQEIVQVPARITQVPRVMPHVVGVITLRDRLLPLVSLRRVFALPPAPVDENGRIVVISLDAHNGASVGIVMDTVKEVLRVNRALIDPVPPLLNGGGSGHEFDSICRLEGGQRLVTILSAARMFSDATLRSAVLQASEAAQSEEDDMARADDPTAQATVDDEEQFVVFRLAGEEYGVPIAAVQEIVRVPDDLTRLPRAPAFMEGVVNLRGTVLPVVDQRRRFALDEVSRNDRQRIMVLTIGGQRTGFIVDSVSEVLKIANASIDRSPRLSVEQERLIKRVANLESTKRMILLLDPSNLLDLDEIEAMGNA